MRITIAVVQFRIQQFAPAENLKKAELFIQQAVNFGITWADSKEIG